MKDFKTFDQQIEILKARGLIFDSEEYAKNILSKENYYNLINGYKKLFIDDSQVNETYKENANFSEIYALYSFDGELRNIFLHKILMLENHIKTALAYEFSKTYGHDNYLKIDNFDIYVCAPRDMSRDPRKIGQVTSLLSMIQKEISKQLENKNPMITHYTVCEGYIPLWVLANILTLGNISKFYTNLQDREKNAIGRYFNLRPREMESILKVLSVYRNQCAHAGRLYNHKAVKRGGDSNSIPDMAIHRSLSIVQNNDGRYLNGKNDLFAIVIIFKLMLPGATFNDFFDELEKYIAELEMQLSSIDLADVLNEMGFPQNWKEIKDCN